MSSAIISVCVDRLGRLASADLQRRYIVGATRDAYMLPEELLEDAALVPEALLKELARDGPVSTAIRDALEDLAEALQTEGSNVPLDGSIPSTELIEHHPAWSAIRDAARRSMEALGVDLVAWERGRQRESSLNQNERS